MFGMQNAPRETPSVSELTITQVQLPSTTAKFDLTLFLSESASGLNCWLEYNTDLFDKTTIARMLRHFERLLQGIVNDPEKRLSRLPLLTDAERAQLLVQWNDTETEYGADRCIHEVFDSQVERMPNAIAVVSETERLSYVSSIAVQTNWRITCENAESGQTKE
jgi:non-ribosomal peptide synthetase component F